MDDAASSDQRAWAEQAQEALWAFWRSLRGGLTPQGELVQHSFELLWEALGRGEPEALIERLRQSLEEAGRYSADATAGLEAMLRAQQGAADETDPPPFSLWPTMRLPQLGLYQHYQRRLQEALDALQRYRQARGDFQRLLDEAVLAAAACCQARLEDLREQHGETPSLRSLYQLWLETSEQAYEQLLERDAYAQALGRLNNSQTALTAHSQQLLDGVLEALDLPSRRALRDTQNQLHQLRREMRALRREQTETP
ncbi:poly(R)-hydroxyalkanoic acid synthase subunit PhaE [Alkalilimnicola sp. S0819]|uniref:poly(R)-hydroxyalkanoic acid synthase subunit PhaE n=1 Tax=Alkalilimnicola sp. S0819 TaxID=2613922 RepID=UPI0012626B4B|nr:poly(R)-hydroxyalkanoic acid synthase subunit PhaE [Alkalilimnicola sp. S0819]KAB7628304.1 hypothetical protein F3N43_00940 [Alkalilimnicola sp. S0819]MPQ15202.1 hypothetical protein [Alkalilimnicola sp. S0819]